MKLVDVFDNIENVNKKKLVIFVIDKYIDLNITDKNEASFMKAFVEKSLPQLIDIIVHIDAKQIMIKIENEMKTCWSKVQCKMCIK